MIVMTLEVARPPTVDKNDDAFPLFSVKPSKQLSTLFSLLYLYVSRFLPFFLNSFVAVLSRRC